MRRGGDFGCCSAHWKVMRVTAAVYAAKRSITASARTQLTSLLPTGWRYVNLFSVKNLPAPRCCFSSKFFEYLYKNYSNTTKLTYCLSTFRLYVGSLHQAHKGVHMDQEDRQHESRRGKVPIEPRMGQAFTYWWPALEVSPDEGFDVKRKCHKQYVNLVALE